MRLAYASTPSHVNRRLRCLRLSDRRIVSLELDEDDWAYSNYASTTAGQCAIFHV